MSDAVKLILLIESSSKNCSVALTDGHALLCLRELSDDTYVHAEKLHSFIEELFAETGLNYAGLSAVAVSKGPGSYTGLRIGVSAAKGICLALNIPLIAVPTTEILARHALKTQPGFAQYVAMIDARRDEVYTATYDGGMQAAVDISSEIVNEDFISKFKAGNCLFVGDGAEKCKGLVEEKYLIQVLPSASMMIEASDERYRAAAFEDTAYFEPFYLKEFIPGKAKKSGLQNM